jgi:NAD(P)-dependent dehydrogenase (short-subunit alcohol dehydrogenase family)
MTRSGTAYDVAGRTVLVTPAARGIGAGVAERLHARGANVALVGLEPERLQALAARLGDRAVAVEADVTDVEGLDRAVEETPAPEAGALEDQDALLGVPREREAG